MLTDIGATSHWHDGSNGSLNPQPRNTSEVTNSEYPPSSIPDDDFANGRVLLRLQQGIMSNSSQMTDYSLVRNFGVPKFSFMVKHCHR